MDPVFLPYHIPGVSILLSGLPLLPFQNPAPWGSVNSPREKKKKAWKFGLGI